MEQQRPHVKLADDFTKGRKLLRGLVGYSDNRSRPYRAYLCLMLAFHVFVVVESGIAIVRFSGNKELVVDAIHTSQLGAFCFVCLCFRQICRPSLHRARDTMLAGFFHYQEELDAASERILRGALPRVRRACRNFAVTTAVAFAAHSIFYWPAQSLITSREQYDALADSCNPYYPHCLYLPFSTREPLGFAAGYLINVVISFYTYGTSCFMLEIYMTLCLELGMQGALLDHSIRTIPSRAERLLARRARVGLSYGNRDTEYEACLVICLRANIQHHQLLKRFQKDILPYTGSVFLVLIILAGLVFGSRLYLLIKGPPMSQMIFYITILMMDNTFGAVICYFGDVVLVETEKLFSTLYSIPWFEYGPRFNKTLHIFMLSTRAPMRVRMLVWDLTACIATYGDIAIVVYKVVNVLRQSDMV